MYKFIFLFSSILLLACNQPQNKNPHVLIVTSFGDIEAELFPGKAPKSVGAFLSYVDSGFYNNSSFYRVVMAEGQSAASNVGLIQGGIWQTNDQKHPAVPGIVHEPTSQTGLSHTSGTVSLARTTPGSASTEFFICIGDQTQFDYGNELGGDNLGFAAFGRVVKGMTIVRKIQEQQRNGESFRKKIIIDKIKRL